MNVFEILRESAMKWPQKPAVHDEHGTVTFSELLHEAGYLRDILLKKGVGKGMGIGVMARNGRNFISGIFGALGTGATVMPMSHQLKPAEIENMLDETKLHFILDDYSGVNPTNKPGEDIPVQKGKFRFVSTGIDSKRVFAPHVNDPAFIRFTSGTTGKSKGVIVSHTSVTERVDAANKALLLGPDDTVVWVLPMAYHFIVSIMLYIRYGAAIAVCRDFLAHTILDYTNRYNGTLLYASPMHIRLLGSDTSGTGLSTLRHVISTSTGISVNVCQNFKKRYGIDVSQAYGIIEIGLPIINYQKSVEHPDAVGYALPDYEVEILDETGGVMPAGVVGQLAMRGPGMFDAYLTPPQTRNEILKNGWFYTADYAVKSSDGLITVKGRQKSMINVSGNKVFAEEVEAVLDSHPAVAASRIYGVAHPLMGEIIQAEVVLSENAQAGTEELLHYCRQRLSTYKLPQRIKFVEHLPMTGSGKIVRNSLTN
jgi:long-chain acyl-CoA synthetase